MKGYRNIGRALARTIANASYRVMSRIFLRMAWGGNSICKLEQLLLRVRNEKSSMMVHIMGLVQDRQRILVPKEQLVTLHITLLYHVYLETKSD
jgi:hypothetical protein